MKPDKEKDDYQKTQSSSSPGNLGEEYNRKKEDASLPMDEQSKIKSAQREGLNEEKSEGDAGAFEGFENTER